MIVIIPNLVIDRAALKGLPVKSSRTFFISLACDEALIMMRKNNEKEVALETLIKLYLPAQLAMHNFICPNRTQT